MSQRRVIVDANIAFRALSSSRGDLRHRLDPSDDFRFIAPRFLFVELFKHKDRLLRAMGKPEDELLDALHALVASLDFTDEAAIPIGTWLEANRLCGSTDPKDTPTWPSSSTTMRNYGVRMPCSRPACAHEASPASTSHN